MIDLDVVIDALPFELKLNMILLKSILVNRPALSQADFYYDVGNIVGNLTEDELDYIQNKGVLE